MKGEAVLFSKKSDDWATPPELYGRLHREFSFDLDAAADGKNAKCLAYLGPGSILAEDALAAPWHSWGHKSIWCNPPYSQVGAFLAKAAEAVAAGATVVMLLPARTDTKWWHTYVWEEENARPRPGVEVRFIRGRLRFGDSTNSAPFPSVVVVFRGKRR